MLVCAHIIFPALGCILKKRQQDVSKNSFFVVVVQKKKPPCACACEHCWSSQVKSVISNSLKKRRGKEKLILKNLIYRGKLTPKAKYVGILATKQNVKKKTTQKGWKTDWKSKEKMTQIVILRV